MSEGALHRDLAGFHPLQTRRYPQIPHHVDSGCIRAGRQRNLDAHSADLNPQPIVRKTTAEHVPRVGGDDAARRDDACHFGDPFGRVGNKENHQRHDGVVKSVIGERQRHRIDQLKLRSSARAPRASVGQLCLGWIYPADHRRRASLDEHIGKGTITTADIEPAQVWAWSEPVKESFTGELAPLAHESFISSPIVESDLVGHD
jgi:hypothetical protein